MRARMEAVMGPLPERRAGRIAFEVDRETKDGGVLRRHLRFVPEEGDEVPAWLLLPEGGGGRRRAALCLHQTTKIGKDEPAGLGGKANLQYGRELALRGYVVLCPDYPNFGEYVCDPYAKGYASATMKGIVNHRAGVSLLAELPGVDGGKIAAVGHSLGGHNALFLAAFDERVKAVVTSCGFTSFARYKGGDLTGWSHRGYMPRIAERYGRDPKRMPFEFAEVLGAMAPRPIFVSAPEKDENFAARGVDEAVRESGHGRIEVQHPECGHDFPVEMRQRAYGWLDAAL